MLMVDYAAVKDGNIVYYADRPARHHNILHKLHRKFGRVFGAGQGFVLSDGRFATRKEAFIIAKAADQIIPERLDDHPYELFSESIFEGGIDTADMTLKQFDINKDVQD